MFAAKSEFVFLRCIQMKKLHGVARDHCLLFILRHAGKLFFYQFQ